MIRMHMLCLKLYFVIRVMPAMCYNERCAAEGSAAVVFPINLVEKVPLAIPAGLTNSMELCYAVS